MNISKKAIMSFLMALTSLVAMAQPYYHIMKEVNGKLTEEAGYDGKDYKIKIDMNGPKPENAIGGKITIESGCTKSKLKRSFYFTNKGNLYYDIVDKRFGFEKSQLDYPKGDYTNAHCGHFNWHKDINECIYSYYLRGSIGWLNATETDFYIANPDNLGKLQNDLGYERWAVLSYGEWDYVLYTLGEVGWSVNGQTCFLIDATPNKSLLTELRNKNNGNPRNLSIEEFKSLEAQGLVCLPACGYRPVNVSNGFQEQGYEGYYWSCTPSSTDWHDAWAMRFRRYYSRGNYYYDRKMVDEGRVEGYAVRLVILADD